MRKVKKGDVVRFTARSYEGPDTKVDGKVVEACAGVCKIDVDGSLYVRRYDDVERARREQ